MCENLIDLLKSCEDSQDEITYISIRNKILIGLGSKWSFNDLITAVSQSKVDYSRYKILVEILERRDGWSSDIPQLLQLLEIQDDEGMLSELKLSLIYLLTINIDQLDSIVISKFTTILDEIFDKIQISSLKFLQRNVFLTTITKLIEAYSKVRDSPAGLFNVDFCFKICNQIKGEKDPRNLLLMFPLLKQLLIHTDTNAVEFYNQVSQILLVYYPINFNPPKNAPQSITEEDLINALNEALSSKLIWKNIIDVLIDGLYSCDDEIDFLDKNVKTISICLPNYGHECVLKYLPQIVEAISTECFISPVSQPTTHSTMPTSMEYEILSNLENCTMLLSLQKWLPIKKHQLLSEVLKVFLQNIPSNYNENAWRNVKLILEMAKNSIMCNNNDLITSIHIIKTIANSCPDCFFNQISDFFHDLIAQMPIKIDNLPIFAQLFAISILNTKTSKITGMFAGKVSQVLEFIDSTICEDLEPFIDIIQAVSTLKLPENFMLSISQKVIKMTDFTSNSERIIVNLSQSTHYLTSLFAPLSEYPLKDGESLNGNIEIANNFFNFLSKNTSIMRFSPENLSILYNKIEDNISLKRFCFIWTISAIATGCNYPWYNHAKSLASMDKSLQGWIFKIISGEIFSKSEFLDLLDGICATFTSTTLQDVLEYRNNPYKLLFVPWLEKYYEKQHLDSAKIIFQELKSKGSSEELLLSLLPIYFKYFENPLNKVQLFGLIKESELTSTDLWSDHLNEIIKSGKFVDILADLSAMLDELCPLRIIPGETWQIVLDTWTNPQNYIQSRRITENMKEDLKSVILTKIYHIDSNNSEQRILFANFILSNIYEYLIGDVLEHKIEGYKCLIRLLSSIPSNLIENKWLPVLFHSLHLLDSDWDDLRLLCLLAKLARYKLLTLFLNQIENLEIIVKYCIRKRAMALSRTISLLIIKEIWNIINSSLELDLSRIVVEYVYKCGRDSHKMVRRMALSTRQIVKLNVM